MDSRQSKRENTQQVLLGRLLTSPTPWENLKYFQTELKINIEELKVNRNLTRLLEEIRQPDVAAL